MGNMFADDTNLFYYGENIDKLLDEVGEDLNKYKYWFDHNKLTLNLEKTKHIFLVTVKDLQGIIHE